MEIETVGQLQVYLLLKKADLLEYYTKRKFKGPRKLFHDSISGFHWWRQSSPVEFHFRRRACRYFRRNWND